MSIPEDQLTEITIKVKDYDNQLALMLDYIMHTANIGHSFEVVVDPELREYTKKFYIDGDGSFYMKEVKVNGKKLVVKDDKIVENYLRDIQC